MTDGPATGVFLGSAAVAAGLITRGRLAGPRYRRLLPDVYAPAHLEDTFALRSRAAYLWARGEGTLTGYSAAELLGASCAPRGTPAELTVRDRHRAAPHGVLARQAVLADDECWIWSGIRLTTPVRTAYDLARRPPLTEAVVALDALARHCELVPSEVTGFAPRYPGARGIRRLPEAVRWTEPAADSPMESRLRMLLVLAGLPRPAVQYPVVDRRAHAVLRVDLAYPEQRVAVEYEGRDHFTDRRVVLDGRRATRLADLGWRMYRYFATDLYRHPDLIVAQITRALRPSAGAPSPRRNGRSTGAQPGSPGPDPASTPVDHASW